MRVIVYQNRNYIRQPNRGAPLLAEVKTEDDEVISIYEMWNAGAWKKNDSLTAVPDGYVATGTEFSGSEFFNGILRRQEK